MSTFSLIVKIADQEPEKHDLAADSVSIGRGPDNGIQILVAEVSVSHGELVKSGDTYKIVDKGSSNGTKVNGRPTVPDGVALAPMDKLLFGTKTPAYFVSSAAAESGSLEDLIASIEAAPKGAAPASPAVAVVPAASPAAPTPVKPLPVKPAAVAPAASTPGSSTVKLEQVRAPKPGGPGGPVAPKPGAAAPLPPKVGGAPAAPVPLKRAEPKAPSIPLPPKKPGAE